MSLATAWQRLSGRHGIALFTARGVTKAITPENECAMEFLERNGHVTLASLLQSLPQPERDQRMEEINRLTPQTHVELKLHVCGDQLYRLAITRVAADEWAASLQAANSERWRHELRSTEELNRRIIEALPVGIVHVTAAGAVVTANAEALRILGLSYDSLTNRYTADFEPETIFEDGSPCSNEEYPVTQALITGQPQPPTTIGVRRPDGETSWAIFTAVPVKDPDTQFTIGAVVTFADITERKAGERERERFLDRMLQSQKLESLGVLAGGVAHDFNNLLVGVMGNAELARLEVSPQSSIWRRLELIENAARHAGSLTHQLLSYAGKAEHQPKLLQVNDFLNSMSDLLAVSVPKSVRLEYDLAPEMPSIQADPNQLTQVIINLVVNGAEAAKSRRGTIVVSTNQIDV
ncbi:MAG: PAS domain-containing protein, partial [Myxococcales bacterium]|nr:PAS domain-containing protein [Myxococcales bacterium]